MTPPVASPHTFHIPVMGMSFSLETPIKVARFGISSVISIIEDGLLEKMRQYYCDQVGEEYIAITDRDQDPRARRITAYLNLVNRIVTAQVSTMKQEDFTPGSDVVKYFEMLPDGCEAKNLYLQMDALPAGSLKASMQDKLRAYIVPGSIDVNIMSKIDNLNTAADGTPLPVEYSDALAAFRGFALSDLSSSVVFSAGYNPRLYNYIEQFPDFFPDAAGNLRKKIILKVSDYRSAMVQGKILAKKGIWISEFRIESGLNCGGHAFATDGILMGPIMEEFKNRRHELADELHRMCNATLAAKGAHTFPSGPVLRITVQGGIGTHREDEFLREYYQVDGTGWGSPFLLVPEATTVEEHTLQQLAHAKKDDYYLSFASPLGIPFNNFRNTSSDLQRQSRVAKGRPGSPCYKKFLSTDTEFTTAPICTSSRQYQDLKIKQLQERGLTGDALQEELNNITEKDCLCEGLTVSSFLTKGLSVDHNLTAVTICPGPNLAYFSGIHSLQAMVDHIYGRINLLNALPRPNMFVNEAQLYIDYYKKLIAKSLFSADPKQQKYLDTFRTNMLKGIEYCKSLANELKKETTHYRDTMLLQLQQQQKTIESMLIPAL